MGLEFKELEKPWEAIQDESLPHYWHIKTRFAFFKMWTTENEAQDLCAIRNNEARTSAARVEELERELRQFQGYVMDVRVGLGHDYDDTHAREFGNIIFALRQKLAGETLPAQADDHARRQSQ